MLSSSLKNSWIYSTIIMHCKISKIRYLLPLRPCPNVTGGRGQKSPTALLKTVLVFLFLFLESWLNQAAIAWLRPETTFVSFLLRYYCSVVPSLVLHPRRIDTHFIHIHNISPISQGTITATNLHPQQLHGAIKSALTRNRTI